LFLFLRGESTVLFDLRQDKLEQSAIRRFDSNARGASVRAPLTDVNLEELEFGAKSDDEI
jgi:hypothetical protein